MACAGVGGGVWEGRRVPPAHPLFLLHQCWGNAQRGRLVGLARSAMATRWATHSRVRPSPTRPACRGGRWLASGGEGHRTTCALTHGDEAVRVVVRHVRRALLQVSRRIRSHAGSHPRTDILDDRPVRPGQRRKRRADVREALEQGALGGLADAVLRNRARGASRVRLRLRDALLSPGRTWGPATARGIRAGGAASPRGGR